MARLQNVKNLAFLKNINFGKYVIYNAYSCLILTTSTGGRDSPKPMANDGWITPGKGGKSAPIDQNKLRSIAKVNSAHPVGLFKRLSTQIVLQLSASSTKHCAGQVDSFL